MCRYEPAAAAHRRETAAKLLTSMAQRDADARRHLIIQGGLKQVLQLLNPKVSAPCMQHAALVRVDRLHAGWNATPPTCACSTQPIHEAIVTYRLPEASLFI